MDSCPVPLGRWLIGYGVYPFRILWWFAGLVVAGWIVLRFEEPQTLRDDQYFWYSLENAIPLVQLAEAHNRVQFTGWVESFFHLQKLLGFVVATVLVGALTGWGA